MKALKSILTGSAVLALSLSSCTADEQLGVNTTQDAIAFSINAINQTRAANSYKPNNMPASFNVWANYTGTDGSKVPYIDDDLVNRNGDATSTSYKPTKTRYWPESVESMNFYAYVDDDNKFDYNNGAPKFVDFKVNSTVAEQLDLMYAGSTGVTKDKSNAIPINFKHALSQVCFNAKNETSHLRITFHKIEVCGLCDKGTFTFPASSDEETNGASWSLSEAEEDKNKSYTIDNLNVVVNPETTESMSITGQKEKEDGSIDYSNVMTLMPQYRAKASGSSWNPGGHNTTSNYENGACFKIWLTVENKADGVFSPVVENKMFYVLSDVNWYPGKRYVYTLTFDNNWRSEGLSTLDFQVSCQDYEDQTENIHTENNTVYSQDVDWGEMGFDWPL